MRPAEITSVNTLDVSYESPYGTIRVAYAPLEDGSRRYEITVPANTLCDVEIEGIEEQTVGSGKWIFDRKMEKSRQGE